MAGLRIKNGPSQGQTFVLGDDPLVIGRDASCDVSLQDKGASRRHAEVFNIGAMSFIRDLDSRNGSFVNDNRIAEEMLRDGDRIQIGGTVLIFEATMGKTSQEDLEFSEEELQGFFELRLEDITSVNVGEGDVSSEKHLRALYRFSRLIASEESEEQLIKKALAFICESFQADGAYLFGRDLEKGNTVNVGTYTPKGRSGQLSRTIIRKVLQDRRALLVTDAMRDDRFSSRESVMRHNIHAVLCAPLTFSGHSQGVLYIAGDDPAVSFNEQELELAAAMADQIGLALSHIASQSRRREHILAAIRLILKVAEQTNPGIAKRNETIAANMLSIGLAMKIKAADLDSLQLAGMMHDFGAMASPAGSVKQEDVPAVTADLLSNEGFFPEIVDVVKYQLETYDGRGPKRLKGGDVPLSVRIFQVAVDLAKEYDPSDGNRAWLDKVVENMVEQGGKRYDSAIVAALAKANKAGLLDMKLEDHWKSMRAGDVASLLHEEQQD